MKVDGGQFGVLLKKKSKGSLLQNFVGDDDICSSATPGELKWLINDIIFTEAMLNQNALKLLTHPPVAFRFQMVQEMNDRSLPTKAPMRVSGRSLSCPRSLTEGPRPGRSLFVR